MKQRDKAILEKIVSEIELLEDLISDASLDQFNESELLKRSSAMTSINIGELAKHLSNGFFEDHPENELRMAARTRDAYAHGYFSLSFDQVYKTSRDDYPRVKQWIVGILSEEAVCEDENEEAQ